MVDDLIKEKTQLEEENKSLLSEDLDIMTTKTSKCPTKNCDGSGNIITKHKTHNW